MPTGVCSWFDNRRGYGFITCDETGNDCFVHQSTIQMEGFRKLLRGQRVEFEMGQDEGGRARTASVVPVVE